MLLVEEALRGPDYRAFLANMYGNKPDEWSDSLTGWDRLRVIVNAQSDTTLVIQRSDGTVVCDAGSGRTIRPVVISMTVATSRLTA